MALDSIQDGMGSLADTGDVTALTDAELGSLQIRLEREERDVSKRRTRVHARIDFVGAGGFASPELADEQLASLNATERELSERRRLLHRSLDDVSAELSRRRTRA